MSGRVLILDDDLDTCELIEAGLRRRGFDAVSVTSAEEALEIAGEGQIDLVVTDFELGTDDTGVDVCRKLLASRPHLPIIIATAHGEFDIAVDAIRAGAYDFITKPISMQHLALTLQRAMEHGALRSEVERLRRQVARAPQLEPLIGDSRPMRRVYELVEQVAAGNATVLITGESGTGKELVARGIHDRSARADAPFVAINCAAMPATLLESELFGHVKGAFTGAVQSRQGLFIQASGGTLFLDEIGEMPMEMQAKLLRVIQERQVRPVGGDREVSFDTRIIAATHRDLEEAVEQGEFREDLFYRINVVGIPVPPLRSRSSDVLLLAQHFLQESAARSHKEVLGLSPNAAQKLRDYDWPGNVRELQNCMERAVTLTRHQELTVDDLPDAIREHQATRLVISADDPEELPTLEEMERRYLRRVLEAVRWNKSQAARILGMDRRTLYRRLDRLEIERPD